jgi:hypothetical protein
MRAISESERPGTRQLFVTRSPVLARHVESSFHSLVDSLNIASKTKEELAAMARQSEKQLDQALMEFDNEVDLRKDLPPRFSLLKKSHFPLFVSFEKVCRSSKDWLELTLIPPLSCVRSLQAIYWCTRSTSKSKILE